MPEQKDVKKEITRLKKIYKDIDEQKLKTVDGLIEEAAFMRCTLRDLKVIIAESGVIDEMPQGEYSILREHPAVKTYNATIQRYSTIIKQLIDLLPKEVQKEVDDGFDEFITKK